MANRVWLPVLAAALLVISGCGDNDETSGANQEETPATSSSEANEESAGGADETESTISSGVENNASDADSAANESSQAEEALAEEESLNEDSPPEEAAASLQDVEAGKDTLASDPEAVLENGGAMPGEATRSDVDEIIAETERRFEEAQQQLEEQFQEVEQQSPVTEPISDEEMAEDWEFESSLPESAINEENRRGSDIEALIEENERRFEEAEQRLNEQYEAIEQQQPETLELEE